MALPPYEQIFDRADKYGLQLKPSKYTFFSTDLHILAHRITPFGRFPSATGTEAISQFPQLGCTTQLKRFLGMVGNFHEYISNLSNRCVHLQSLLSKDVPLVWSAQHEFQFQDLKNALLTEDVLLKHPDWDSPFEVHADASKRGCGAMLAQWQNGILRPVRSESRSFSTTESDWPTFHQELYAVKWALEQFRHYFLGRKCTVVTDHANLKFLASVAPQNSKLAQ